MFEEAEITNKQLLEFNRQGFIPGPREKNTEFLSRVRRYLHLYNHMEDFFAEGDFPFLKEQHLIPEQHKIPALALTERLFDLRPQWVPAFYSNHQLNFWHGGSAWIPLERDARPKVYFQLRREFRRKPSYLGLYQRKEILAHEMIHVGRMAFPDSIFEEFFAYQTSPSAFRRHCAAILDSSEEANIFLSLLAILTTIDIALLSAGLFSYYYKLAFLKLVPFAMMAYAFRRLWKRRSVFRGCLKKFTEALGSAKTARSVLYRLTEEEMYYYAERSAQTILQEVEEKRKQSLRWRLIALAYFQ